MVNKSTELKLYANNLRRLMARLNMTMDQVISASGLSERTVKDLLGGRIKPHARTLHRLAAALDVTVDEFFWPSIEPRLSNDEIRNKVDLLLASDQRNLLIELVDVLSRCSNGSTSGSDNSTEPRIAVIPLH
jgi:transcriptional regulator with XRE-family HTH domain